MRKLNIQGYKELRENAYKQAGILGDAAERFQSVYLEEAYNKSCESLDAIDCYGYAQGFLNEETNEYIDDTTEECDLVEVNEFQE